MHSSVVLLRARALEAGNAVLRKSQVPARVQKKANLMSDRVHSSGTHTDHSHAPLRLVGGLLIVVLIIAVGYMFAAVTQQ